MSIEAQAKEFLARVEQYISTNSNPDLIKQILVELNLHNMTTNNKEFKDFLLKISKDEIDLKRLIHYVKLSILNNQPLCTLLAFIQENNLVSDVELADASRTLQLQINMLCLFEAVVITMANGQYFAQDVYDHLLKRSPTSYPGNPFADFFFGAPLKASLFERLKMISIKPGILNILFHKSTGENEETKADVDAFIIRKQLSGWNADIEPANADLSYATVSGMGLNILEAAWEDSTGHAKESGGVDNAKSGIGLINIMEEKKYASHFSLLSHMLPEGVALSDEAAYGLLPDLKINGAKKKVLQFDIDAEWRDIYNSWNLFFVISNINTVFMPIKLLLPSILSATPENYKEVRLLSLFLMGSLFLHEDVKNKPFFASDYSFKKATIILEKWGEINKRHASQRMQKVCPDSPANVDDLYEHIFGNYPNINFFLHLLSFAYNPQQHNLTKNYTMQSSQQKSPLFFAATAPAATTTSTKGKGLADNAPTLQ
ncbi:symporter [Legionella brunensis]|uniref:Symporter n=1 Tax=Legionella brunensis TaxID=29422 RepID=A0A0W0SNW9_9GAMM|nr:symporter [Legionella brunensis]KTC84929.1 symporter [Legionella brunensis]